MSEKIIAVDFDGTLVRHKFPEIGDEVPGAFEWLQKFQAAGANLILWTIRSSNYQLAALEYCQARGVEFWGVNLNPDQETWSRSPKAYAHVYIDDAAFGCPLIEFHTDRCFGVMNRYGEQLPCTCNERPYVDWDVVGPGVMRWLENGD